MNLRRLLTLQAILTFASFLTLIAAPTLIPSSFDIIVSADQFLLCYLLAAAELGLAYLSVASRKLADPNMLRTVCTFFITFHATTGILCLYCFLQGASPKIIGNAIFRFVLIAAFYYYGIHQTRNRRLNDKPHSI